MAIASLVLGIISIVLALFFAGFQWVGAIAGIIGIILGAMSRKIPEKKGMATAGLVLSIIGFVLSIILFVACAACIGALGAAGAAGALS